MGFTQEKKINTDVCDFCTGCEEHCKFGLDFYYNENEKKVACPTIGGERIKEFLCKDGTWKISEKEEKCVSTYDFNRFHCEMMRAARQIATLCDKYKAR